MFRQTESSPQASNPGEIQDNDSWQQTQPPRYVSRVNWDVVRPLLFVGILVLVGGVVSYRLFRERQREQIWSVVERMYDDGKLVAAGRHFRIFAAEWPDDPRVQACLMKWSHEQRMPIPEARWVHRELMQRVYRGDPYGTISEELIRSASLICPELNRLESEILWSQTIDLCLPELPRKALQNPEIRLVLARGQKLAGQLDDAARQYTEAIRLGDRSLVPVVGLAELFRDRHSELSEAAEEDARAQLAALENRESNPASPRRLSLLDLLQRRLAREIDPVWQGQVELSRRELAVGRWQKAAELVNTAWQSGGDQPDVWFQTLQVLSAEADYRRRTGDWDGGNQVAQRAMEAAGKAAADAPGDSRFPLFQGMLQLLGKQAELAEDYLREAERRAWVVANDIHLSRPERVAAERQMQECQLGLATCLVMQLEGATPGRVATISRELDSLQAQFDHLQLYELSRVLKAQRLMKTGDLEQAARDMSIVAKATDWPSVRRMANLSEAECLRKLQDWRSLYDLATEMTMNDPGWDRGWDVLAEACQRLGLRDELQEVLKRRRVWDPASILQVRIDEQLKRPVEQRRWTLIEGDLDRLVSQFGPTWPGLGVQRVRVMLAKNEWVAADRVLREVEDVTPRRGELLRLRLELELQRRDRPPETRSRLAVEGLERYRRARQELLPDREEGGLNAARFGEILEGRFPSEPPPGIWVVRAMVQELADADAQKVQQAFEQALQETRTRAWAGQKLLEYTLRMEHRLAELNDYNLGLLTGLLRRLPGSVGQARALAAWKHWEARATIPDNERQLFAQTLLQEGEPVEAAAQFEVLLDAESGLDDRHLDFLFFVLGYPVEKSCRDLEQRVDSILTRLEKVQAGSLEAVVARARQEVRQGRRDKGVATIRTLLETGTESRPTAMLRSLAYLGRGDQFLSRLGSSHPANQSTYRQALQEWLTGRRGSDQARGMDGLLLAGRYSPALKAELASVVAAELSRWGLLVQADQILAETIRTTEDPQLVLERGLLLGKSGQWKEALVFFQSVDERLPREAAQAYRVLVEQPRVNAECQAAVEQRLEKLISPNPCPRDRVPLMLLQAELKTRPDTLPTAVTLYDRLLQIEPDSPLLLNNIACVEAFVPERMESGLKHILRAIEQDVPRLEYVDTQALLLLQMDDLDRGLGLLLSQLPLLVRPEHRLHLGVALLRSGMTDAAREVQEELEVVAQGEFSPLNRVLWDELRAGPRVFEAPVSSAATPLTEAPQGEDDNPFVPPAPSGDAEPENDAGATPEGEASPVVEPANVILPPDEPAGTSS